MRDLALAPEDLFWYWISERHSIYLRRQRGEPKPWTQDPILQRYKFTNPFRENDRGTVWLRKNFLEPHWSCHDCDKWNLGIKDGKPCETCLGLGWEPALVAFNICWYRMFNWTGTGSLLGWQTKWLDDFEMNTFALKEALAAGEQVFTGAHIIYSPPGRSKIDAIMDVCTDLWHLRGFVMADALATKSLEVVFNRLQTVACVGGFMAYEMVTDMRHTRLLGDATDTMTWANPGPGAIRGLRRLGYPSKPRAQAIESMRVLLRHAHYVCGSFPVPPEVMPADFPTFEMRDIEHSLCEFDKYCRVKFGEGEPRAKYNGVI